MTAGRAVHVAYSRLPRAEHARLCALLHVIGMVRLIAYLESSDHTIATLVNGGTVLHATAERIRIALRGES